jgi:serine/threonine protein kinase
MSQERAMNEELWQRLKPLYAAAIQLPKEERASFVTQECEGDPELREALEALLAAHEEGTSPLDRPIVQVANLLSGSKGVFSPGDLVLNRFQIVRELDSGGMGEVYEAIDLLLEPGRIALKTIRHDIAGNPTMLARFKEEVLLARQVKSPYVCRIYSLDIPEHITGCTAFLTMEFLEGRTLSDRIAQDGPLPSKEALAIADQLCAALRAIHEANVVHRDLKPRNIMLVPRNGSEQAVVMDFGLARALAPSAVDARTGITMPGVVMGTPDYMAPEQFDPDFEGGKVTPATDIYALGIVLYEMMTGRRPFAAATAFGAAVRRGRRPDPPSSIRGDLKPVWDDVIAKCLEYDPKRRYQSANELLDALHEPSLFVWRFG